MDLEDGGGRRAAAGGAIVGLGASGRAVLGGGLRARVGCWGRV